MSSELQQCLRLHLESLAREGKIISYRQLAMLAQVPEPQVIRKVAESLEAIVREDHAAGIEASVACLVVSQTDSSIPRAGFFMLLRELGLYNGPDEGEAAAVFHADCVRRVCGRYS